MKRIGDVLSVIFNKDFMEKARGYSVMFSCWKDLTEKNGIAAAADHSWIQSVERGLVWIEVDHPGWKQILQTKESKLLSDFRRRFPEMDISGLSIMLCRPDSLTTKPNSPDQALADLDCPQVVEPLPESEPAAEGYDAIKDGPLKDALMRLEQNVTGKNTAI